MLRCDGGTRARACMGVRDVVGGVRGDSDTVRGELHMAEIITQYDSARLLKPLRHVPLPAIGWLSCEFRRRLHLTVTSHPGDDKTGSYFEHVGEQ